MCIHECSNSSLYSLLAGCWDTCKALDLCEHCKQRRNNYFSTSINLQMLLFQSRKISASTADLCHQNWSIIEEQNRIKITQKNNNHVPLVQSQFSQDHLVFYYSIAIQIVDIFIYKVSDKTTYFKNDVAICFIELAIKHFGGNKKINLFKSWHLPRQRCVLF